MYRMAIMTMLAPKSLASRLDLNNCMKMALVHDMAEALVTDITPSQNVPKAEKSRMEETTMEYIAHRLLGNVNGDAADEILRLWREYEDNRTDDANFVHDIDKMELELQTLEYERSHNTELDEFYGMINVIKSPEIKAWAERIEEQRRELRRSRGKPTDIPAKQLEQGVEAEKSDS